MKHVISIFFMSVSFVVNALGLTFSQDMEKYMGLRLGVEKWVYFQDYLEKSNRADQARDRLFGIINTSRLERDQSAEWAIYYITLFENAEELLPKVNFLLKDAIFRAQREQPQMCKAFFSGDGEFIVSLDEFQQKLSDSRLLYKPFCRILRLKKLANALEFNAKIPPEERERFIDIRCEIVRTYLGYNFSKHAGPWASIQLNKGEERFELYLREYPLPPGHSIGVGFQWENEDRDYSNHQDNPNMRFRKAFYERELANPADIYTENQLEYIRYILQRIERIEEKRKKAEAENP